MNLLINVVFVLLQISYAVSKKFPDDFMWGVATSAYQIEGAWNYSGKGESMWDNFVHLNPSPILDQSTGDVATDSYHYYPMDIEMCKFLGVDFYRFSISWPRIVPTGFANEINEQGIMYYNNVINSLIRHNIVPFVTIFHWDLPKPLQDMGGWLSPLIIDYYVDFARILFKKYGDRVKTWITINEPTIFCYYSYGVGSFAPGIKLTGISEYLCIHHILLAHAKVYRMYEREFKHIQNGKIGITDNSLWLEPYDLNSPNDIKTAEIAMEVATGITLNPIFSEKGDYPAAAKQRIASLSKKYNYPRSRLPIFTDEQIEELKGSSDFLGLNHYSTFYSTPTKDEFPEPSYKYDIGTSYIPDATAPQLASPLFQFVPWGLRKLLVWIKNKYNNPVVYITENGMPDNEDMNPGGINDTLRADFINQFVDQVSEAIDQGCNVKGYTFWSLIDNFEWSSGYSVRFGIVKVDPNDPKKTRTPKYSALIYKHIIKNNEVDFSYTPQFPLIK